MNKESLYRLEKLEYKDKFILVKCGNFYKTYEDDAIILWEFFGYKLINHTSSFPLSVLGKVISKLNRVGISVVVIKDSNNINYYNSVYSNNYEKYKTEAINEYKIENRIENVKILVKNKIKENQENYYRITNYINTL